MLRQSITLYNYEKRKAEIISTFINAEIYHDHYKKNHHPFSRLIVEKLPAFYKLHGFILLKTCLRYSDILELDLAAITNEAAFGIIQNKTKRKITRDFKINDSGLKVAYLQISK